MVNKSTLLKIIQIAYRKGVLSGWASNEWSLIEKSKNKAEEIFKTYIEWNSTMKIICLKDMKGSTKSNKSIGTKKAKKKK